MESDAVRTVGDSTVVDMWVSGKFRSVSIPREAIAGSLDLSPDRAAAMSDQDLREFVRRYLRTVAAAAADALTEMSPNADSVTIDADQLRRYAGEPVARRRQAGNG